MAKTMIHEHETIFGVRRVKLRQKKDGLWYDSSGRYYHFGTCKPEPRTPPVDMGKKQKNQTVKISHKEGLDYAIEFIKALLDGRENEKDEPECYADPVSCTLTLLRQHLQKLESFKGE